MVIKESYVVGVNRVCPYCQKSGGIKIVMKEYRHCSYCGHLLEEVVWNETAKVWEKLTPKPPVLS